MIKYTQELRNAIIYNGVKIANNTAGKTMKEVAFELSREFNEKPGAIYDRLGNVVHLHTNGQRGRNIKYGTEWVINDYNRLIKGL